MFREMYFPPKSEMRRLIALSCLCVKYGDRIQESSAQSRLASRGNG